MMGDIFGQLARGQLHAMGFQTAPTISDGPIPIPDDVFDGRLWDEWQSDMVSASGYVYERVTVLSARKAGDENAVGAGVPASRAPAVRQDRSMYDLCFPVFEALRAENKAYIDLAPEKLLDRFQERYAELHGDVANLKPAPQLRTLRKHLNQYREWLRQVSASTSNVPNNT
ncbi:hypothetical protein [Phenylobacterium sp.]|uniref:hypothetical protein n=1 Tax=Phenylobacterium sp. TaxID=1871053 RepID=UPI00301CB9D8